MYIGEKRPFLHFPHTFSLNGKVHGAPREEEKREGTAITISMPMLSAGDIFSHYPFPIWLLDEKGKPTQMVSFPKRPIAGSPEDTKESRRDVRRRYIVEGMPHYSFSQDRGITLTLPDRQLHGDMPVKVESHLRYLTLGEVIRITEADPTIFEKYPIICPLLTRYHYATDENNSPISYLFLVRPWSFQNGTYMLPRISLAQYEHVDKSVTLLRCFADIRHYDPYEIKTPQQAKTWQDEMTATRI